MKNNKNIQIKNNIADMVISPAGEALQYFKIGKKEYLQSSSGIKYPVIQNIIHFIDDIELRGNNFRYQKMYDKLAGFYDFVTRFYAKLKSGGEEKRLMEYLSLLNINDTDKVIEISVGTGRNIKYLNPNAEYYGVDISLKMLKQCYKNMKKLNREITLIQAEAEALPLKNESFDVVFSAGGFNFFNDPQRAVYEMLRIAKNGTKILITDETENLRLKHKNNNFYNNNTIKNPAEYLPDYCKNVMYKEICNGDLYALTFYKP